jgi:hypothetical protein
MDQIDKARLENINPQRNSKTSHMKHEVIVFLF